MEDFSAELVNNGGSVKNIHKGFFLATLEN